MPMLHKAYAGQGLGSISSPILVTEFNHDDAGVVTSQIPWLGIEDKETESPSEFEIEVKVVES